MKDDIIEELIDRIESNCEALDVDDLYDQMLDEVYSFAGVGGPFDYMQPSKVLKEMDPTAYRCGRNDWVDGEDFTEVKGCEYRDSDIEEVREELLSELEDELADVDAQIDDLDEDSGMYDYEYEFADLVGQKDRLQANIDKVRKYSF